jgi:PKD repeat protein
LEVSILFNNFIFYKISVMKKIYSFLLILFALVASQSNAQYLCTPTFTVQYINGNTIKCNPVLIDTPAVQHYWTFGDGTSGSSASAAVFPTHVYANAGVYTVCHYVIRQNPNNVTVCMDSICMPITIQQANTCNISASYTKVVNAVNPLLRFYNNTTLNLSPLDSVRWNFGDGTSFNYTTNGSHTFAAPGIYNVCLRVKRNYINQPGSTLPCVSEYCRTDTVLPATTACNIQTYFTSSIDSGSAPATVQFTNQTSGLNSTDTIRWAFGDGTMSTALNPSHIYTSPGIYVVCLTVTKPTPAGAPYCGSTYCKTILVTPTSTPCNLVANFTYYKDSLITIPNSYHFTNTTVPLSSTDSIRWSFGDGTFSSQINPNHAYANYGTYTVCLRVIKRNPNGVLSNCISEKCYPLTVIATPAPCTLVANFVSSGSPANSSTIVFTNTTLSTITATNALWSFGDGTSSTSWNTTHSYLQSGIYYVCLRVQSGNCISYKCDSVLVTVTPPSVSCNQLSSYSFSNINSLVTFTSNFVVPNVQYTWTFGDGTGAIGSSTTHLYSTSGNRTACLTAFKDNNCASTTCKTISIVPNCSTITLAIGDVRDSLVPNRVTFTAYSNNTTINQQWTITRISNISGGSGTLTINSNNPTYMFLDSGVYNVCVKATFTNGCIKTICKTIYIAYPLPTSNNCTLQVYPNPATVYANAIVSLAQPLLLDAKIYNSANVLVAQKQQQGFVGNNAISVNILNLSSGLYTFKLAYGNQICSATFVKQ